MNAAHKTATVALIVLVVVLSPLLAAWMAVSRGWRRHHDSPIPRRTV